MDSSDVLRQAIAAARAGRHAQARGLLLEVVQADPRNEVAWLWLSDQADDWGDRIAALENALAINPGNAPVRERLDQLRNERQQAQERKAAALQEQFQKARQAAQAGQRQETLDLLLQYVQNDQSNEQAWLLLGNLVPDIKDRLVALENALTLNPGNDKTKARLDELQRLQNDPLALGILYEEQGEIHLAITAYMAARVQLRAPAARAEAKQRLEVAQRRAANLKFRVVHPTLTLVRLATGPLLLYGLLVLIQGGLNPLYVSPLLCLGSVGVWVGSFLIAAAATKPRHPVLLSVFNKPGATGGEATLLALEVIGWVMLLAPYLLFAWSAVERLDIYRATLR